MIRIAICEDEQILLERLSGQVSMILDQHSIEYNMDSFRSGSALLAREAYDILLLDIEMEPMDGLELAGKLRMRGDKSYLVFITAHQQYAVDAYDVHPYHYLVKPVEPKKLEAVLLQICASLRREHSRAVIVRQGTAVRRVPLELILYLEVLDRKIYLHTVEETFPFYGKLEDLEPALTRPEPVPGIAAAALRSEPVSEITAAALRPESVSEITAAAPRHRTPADVSDVPPQQDLASAAAASSNHPRQDSKNISLPDTFFRCHRSYIVNLRHVQLYDKNEICLDNEERIPLSKRRYKSFGLAFMHYLKESGDVF